MVIFKSLDPLLLDISKMPAEHIKQGLTYPNSKLILFVTNNLEATERLEVEKLSLENIIVKSQLQGLEEIVKREQINTAIELQQFIKKRYCFKVNF